MDEVFDFAWHDFDVTDIVLDEIGTPVVDLAGLSPSSSSGFEHDLSLAALDDCADRVGKACHTCVYFHLRTAWPGYEQWGLTDDDEWVQAPPRSGWHEKNVYKGYCARRQCWRQPDDSACPDALIHQDDSTCLDDA